MHGSSCSNIIDRQRAYVMTFFKLGDQTCGVLVGGMRIGGVFLSAIMKTGLWSLEVGRPMHDEKSRKRDLSRMIV